DSPLGDADPHTAFYQGNAAYKAGDYAGAAGAYERLLNAGLASGPLYFNLGNAYFKNGHVGQAILNFERAHRLMPRDPDVRANLAYAAEIAKDIPEASPLWQRLAFPLAARATTGELATLASLLWFVL